MLITFPDRIPAKTTPISLGEKIKIFKGIDGLEGPTSFEFLCLSDNWPFGFLQPLPAKEINVVVIEPAGWIKNYAPQLSDRELAALDIYAQADALILNLVKLAGNGSLEAFVDLTRPIVINRHNLVGQQLTPTNAAQYSNTHPLTTPTDAM